MSDDRQPGVHIAHGWLPVILPVRACRFAVADSELAFTLRAASADPVDSAPALRSAKTTPTPVRMSCSASRGSVVARAP